MEKLINKICLGTAQFGLDYGIANQRGRIAVGEIDEILTFASQKGIEALDTGRAYGESENILGRLTSKHPYNFRMTTKTPSLNGFEGEGNAKNIIQPSLKALRREKIYGYLVHQFSDYLTHHALWGMLEELKREGIVQKIGFSIYKPEELELLFDRNVPFDIIQFPYSIFDRRFEQYFSLLRKKNIEINVRSVFLQGLAFLNPDTLPEHLVHARDDLKRLIHESKEINVPVHAVCLNFVLLNSDIDIAVIGIDSLEQLKQNIDAVKFLSEVQRIYDDIKAISINDENILLPYNWKVA